MTDADGKQMAVKNVIILYCPVSLMGDSSGCVDMDLTGGSGVYLSNGAYENITWKRAVRTICSLSIRPTELSSSSTPVKATSVLFPPTNRQAQS